MSKKIYAEYQSFRYSWSYWLCLAITLLLLYGCLVQLVFKEPFGTRPAPDMVLILCALLLLSLFALLHFSSLQLRLDANGLAVRFLPFINSWRCHTWEEIKALRLISYSPLGEYGGWGIRGEKKRRCYSVSGNHGIEVLLNDGNRLLIGTQQKDTLSLWLETTKTTRA